MERAVCLKAEAKGGPRLALAINTASTRCKLLCCVCLVLVENELEILPYASLQKVKKKKR